MTAQDGSAGVSLEPERATTTAWRVLRLVVPEPSGVPAGPAHLLLAVLRQSSGGNVGQALLQRIAAGTGRGPQAVLDDLARALDVDLYGTPFTGSDADILTAPGVADLVAAAQRISARVGAAPVVHARHLLGVAVSGPWPDEVRRAVGEPDPPSAFLDALHDVLPAEPLEPWRAALAPTADPPRGAVDLDGRYASDAVGTDPIPLSHDDLGVATDVAMLAALITRDDAQPPLSVGLFGAWGSGKSYFMRLLGGQVDELALRARQARDEGRPTRYVGDVVQIGFNAWSYADANLWASLGDEIFTALAGPGEDDEGRRAQLRAELTLTNQQAVALEAARQAAEDRVVALRDRLDGARAARRTTATQLLAAARDAGLGEDLQRVWRRLGVDDEARRAALLADEVQGVDTDLRAARRDVAAAGLTRAAWLLVGVVALLAVLVWTGLPGRWLAGLGVAGLAGSLGTATLALASTHRATTGLRDVVHRLRSVRDADRQAEVVRAADALRQAQAREEVVAAELARVRDRAGELSRELSDLDPGQQLYRFVAERAGSDDYRARQSLISLVRRDFQRLAELMDRWRRDPGGGSPRPIDRIVLYIDDLDRCPPRQVVEVLQAVHLLLATRLFVVVVGVDPRWLLHSLTSQYADALGGPGGELASTPQQYLEKIFNIPYVLPAMTSEAFSSLVARHTAGRRPVVDVRDADSGAVDGADASSTAALTAGPAAALTAEPGSEAAAVQAGQEPEPMPYSDGERALLGALAPLVPSPREAKRLLNLYGLLRSTRGPDFLGGDGAGGEYQAVAVLLGVLSGAPDLFGALLHGAAEGDTPGGLCVRDPGGSWADVVAGLGPRQYPGAWGNEVAYGLDPAARVRWAWLARACRPSVALVTLPDLHAFAAWAPRVARFSFLVTRG